MKQCNFIIHPKKTRSTAVAEKEPIALAYLQFQTEVCFWHLLVWWCMTSIHSLCGVVFGCSGSVIM